MLELLQVLFIALKLTGFINWSWFVVLIPSIVILVLAFVAALLGSK